MAKATQPRCMEDPRSRGRRSLFARRRLPAILVCTVACGLALAACGSSSSSSQAGTGSAKSPVTVMLLNLTNGVPAAAPNAPPVATALVKKLNTQGGLDGHPINLVECNEKANVNIAANCARTAIQDNAVAVVEGLSYSDSTALELLNQAGIITIIGNGPILPTQATSPIAYPLNGGFTALVAADGIMLANQGCKRLGIIQLESAAAEAGAKQLETAFLSTATGGKVTDVETTSESTADYAPVIAKIDDSGAQCIGIAASYDITVQSITAVRSSSKPNLMLATTTQSFSTTLATQMGSKADGVIASSTSYLPGDPQAADFVSFVNSIPGGGAKYETSDAQNVYSGFIMLQNVAKT